MLRVVPITLAISERPGCAAQKPVLKRPLSSPYHSVVVVRDAEGQTMAARNGAVQIP